MRRAGLWGLIAEHMDADGGQHFNGHAEWGLVFLTPENGGTNILNIHKQASIIHLRGFLNLVTAANMFFFSFFCFTEKCPYKDR